MNKANRLGALGELLLQQWAVESGLSVNKAFNDTTGWDFFIEWPLTTPASTIPLDRRGAPIQCLVQVKATRAQQCRLSVSLKNWEHLCRSHLPAFFLILHFDTRDRCTAAYLVHVWELHIAAVLKRLRELSNEGIRDLGTRTLSLTWGLADQLTEPSSAAFVEGIVDAVGVLEDYSRRKHELLSTLGGAGGWSEGVVSIEVPESYRTRPLIEFMDDFHLGRIPEVPTTGATLWDVRFGIRAKDPSETISTRGKITLPSDAGRPGTLTLETAGHRLKVSARAFSVIRDLNAHDAKARIAAPFTEIYFRFRDQDVRLRFQLPDADEQVRLEDLSTWAEIYELFAATGTESRLRLKMSFEDFHLGTLEVERVIADEDLYALAEAARCAWKAVRFAGAMEFAVCSVNLLWRQRQDLAMLDEMMRGGIPGGMIAISMDGITDLDQPICVPTVIPLRMEKALILFPCYHIGYGSPASIDGELGLNITVERSRIEDPVIWTASEFSPSDHKDLLERIAAPMSRTHQIARWWVDSDADGQ